LIMEYAHARPTWPVPTMLTFERSLLGGIEGEPAPNRSSRNDPALTERARFRLLPGALRRVSRLVGARRGVAAVARAAKLANIARGVERDGERRRTPGTDPKTGWGRGRLRARVWAQPSDDHAEWRKA
jgi:hypothetical protein